MYVCVSRSRTSSESALEEDKPRQEESGVGALSPLTYGRISSDESEADGSDELAEYPSSATHPKPLAVRRHLCNIIEKSL